MATDPMDPRRCRAKNRRGQQCGRPPTPGAAVCASHGSKAPQVARKAAERKAIAEWIEQTEPIVSPLEALLEVAREIAGFKDFMAARVAEMRAESWRYAGATAEQLRAEIGLYERALDRTARVLVDINRLGLEERRTALAEEQGALVADALIRILDALDLTPAQQERAAEVAPRELRAISGESA